MIPTKTKKEIEIMKEGGKKLSFVFGEVLQEIKPGIKLKELDKLAESLIVEQGGFPSFKTVKGYNWATCININEGVVHGVPNDYRIKEGDVVSLDIGMLYRGFHTDMARTVLVRNQKSKVKSQKSRFLGAGKKALRAAITVAKPGKRVGHISAAIEREIRKSGFSPVEALTGHGVGRKLHEEPQIPCFLAGKIEETPLLEQGITLAIEVIYTGGKPDLILEDNGWTIKTADNSLAGLFENTILITKKGPIILTPLETKLEVC